MAASKWKHLPIEVEAWQAGSGDEYPDWINSVTYENLRFPKIRRYMVYTDEGAFVLDQGCYLVKDPIRGIYGRAKDVFEKTHERCER